jgi:hypothetical protein
MLNQRGVDESQRRKKMQSEEFVELVKQMICEESEIENSDIVTVWLCKTIQNWKGLFYNFSNMRYYEATYNGDKKEMYLDRYVKERKKVYKVEV